MKLLIIEDNKGIRKMLSKFLSSIGNEVLEATTGEEGLELFSIESPDLVLLDLMLPGIDGFEVCRHIRKVSMVPVIMITAKSEDHDKILGLDVGADDYLVKPFSHEELAARIRAVMRRIDYEVEKEGQQGQELIGLVIDSQTYKMSLFDQEIHLTKKEFELLYLFVTHPNQLFSRDHLLDRIWGIDYYGDSRTVDSHIKRLREKLKVEKSLNWQIKTVWGKGYLFEVTYD